MRFLLLALLALQAAAQTPGVRVLIISNSSYQKLTPLLWASSDAEVISQALEKVVKPVITRVSDASIQALRDTIEEKFIPTVNPGDVLILYFAGYSVQSDGQNYFLGVDFDAGASGPMRDRAYLIDRLRTYVQARNPEVALVLINGASDDPALANVEGYAPGLTASRPIRNGLIMYSIGQDQSLPTTSEGPSVFASEFSSAIQIPGLSVVEFATRLAAQVSEKTKGVQRPYINPDYAGVFHFVAPPPPPKAPKPEIQIVHEGPDRRQNRTDREYYVRIPAGKFLMGCVPSVECEPHEKPQHPVEITNSFWLGETELTVTAYQRFVEVAGTVKMPKKPAGFDWKDGSIPIVMVSWEDAQKYCTWSGGRLPTEAEWEYAARAGSVDQVYPMKDFSQARDVANFKGKSGNDIYDWVAPVAKFDKNAFGLHDMSGNVWEWVLDAYSPAYYQGSPAKDPTGPEQGKEHVIRGGSFDSDPMRHLRLSYRDKSTGPQNKIGFRCLLPDGPDIQSKLQ